MSLARLAVGALSMLLLSTGAGASSCPLHLVTVEPDGSASEGSKNALREVFRAGLPLRVGWSLNFDADDEPEVIHWSDSGCDVARHDGNRWQLRCRDGRPR